MQYKEFWVLWSPTIALIGRYESEPEAEAARIAVEQPGIEVFVSHVASRVVATKPKWTLPMPAF